MVAAKNFRVRKKKTGNLATDYADYTDLYNSDPCNPRNPWLNLSAVCEFDLDQFHLLAGTGLLAVRQLIHDFLHSLSFACSGALQTLFFSSRLRSLAVLANS